MYSSSFMALVGDLKALGNIRLYIQIYQEREHK
jgi:hypothetical protein